MANSLCPVCEGQLTAGLDTWHFQCQACGYEQGVLVPRINSSHEHRLIDEGARKDGLKALRIANFKTLLRALLRLKPEGGRLLDVGCAHGWFMECARGNFTVLGLEPDRQVFEAVARRGLPVRMGYFPAAIRDDETFDVIVFNDVIEHIPDIDGIVAACHRLLTPDGLLVLNLPSSQGFFYRLSKVLHGIGVGSFFARLWQKDLPSPHLHYFRNDNLARLLHRHGFGVENQGTLPTLRLTGLFSRICYEQSTSLAKGATIYLGVALLLPFLSLLPSDIFYVVVRKKPVVMA